VTLVHAVVVTTRSRAGEAVALRAIGVRPRSLMALVETQAVALSGLATLAGVPLGLALGRQVWSPIADRASVVDLAVAPWSGAAWVALALVGGAMVLAVPLALTARRPSLGADRRVE
jgi:ABC-type antimicrobial peptide transport system permease subunit